MYVRASANGCVFVRAEAEFMAFLLSFKQAVPHCSEKWERPGRVSQENKEEDEWNKIDREVFLETDKGAGENRHSAF